MITNFLITAIRNIRKRSGYILLNLGGLIIGITSFLFIALFVIHELSFDRFHKNYRNIYRIKVVGQMTGNMIDQAVTAPPMANAMLNDYPEIEQAARVREMGDWLIRFGDKKFNESGVLFADSTFFDVLDFRMIKGDPHSALARPRSLVLTEEYAKKYFGSMDPVGQHVRVESDTVLYTVTGVIENVPDNSHIKFDMLASLSTFPGMANNQQWISHFMYTYIVLKDGTDKDAFQRKLQDMVIKYVGPQLKQIVGITLEEFIKSGNEFRYILEPLKDIHLKGATQYNLEPPGSLSTVYIFAVIAVMILAVAIINYINLATAKSASRAKEVGIKKVSGAYKSGLMAQFLGESFLIVAFAAVIAIVLVLALTPAFTELTGTELSFSQIKNLPGILSIIILVLLVSASSGFYPAFVLASYDPSEVLKGTTSPGSMSKRLRNILVVFQFTVSIVIIIGSIIVYRQLNFMTKKDLGFNRDNLLVIRRADAIRNQMELFRNQLLEIPGIKNVGFSMNIPGTDFYNNGFFKDEDPDKNTYLIHQGICSFDFPEAMGIRLAEGRFFSHQFNTDSSAILINEAAVKSLGLKDPLGKYILQPTGTLQMQKLKIIGIMKDFNIESLHKAIPPVCFTIYKQGLADQYALVKLTGKDIPGTVRAIEKVWQDFTSVMPFQYDFFADRWENLYTAEIKISRIFLIFSFLAIFIACLGLIGLVAYITNKRTKEIGIRKSYGASNIVVLGLLSAEVIILIGISSLLAYPLAFFGSKYWLESFASRIPVSPFIYISATLITLIIGWLSICYQTIKAANNNPAKALRVQ